jgi:hypothetical protein
VLRGFKFDLDLIGPAGQDMAGFSSKITVLFHSIVIIEQIKLCCSAMLFGVLDRSGGLFLTIQIVELNV